MKRLVVLMLLLTGCHGHATVHAPVVDRGRYAYQQQGPTVFRVQAVAEPDLRAALEEIGCGREYVCAIEKNSTVFHVERVPK